MEDHLLNNEALVNEIASIIINARNNVIKNINTELIDANWNIGCIIVEDELKFQHGNMENDSHYQKLLSINLEKIDVYRL